MISIDIKQQRCPVQKISSQPSDDREVTQYVSPFMVMDETTKSKYFKMIEKNITTERDIFKNGLSLKTTDRKNED